MKYLIFLLCFNTVVSAAIYKCKDSQGRIIYSEKKCENAEQIKLPKAPSPSPGEPIIREAPLPAPVVPVDPYQEYLRQKEEEALYKKTTAIRKKQCAEYQKKYQSVWMNDPIRAKQYLNRMREICF